MDSNNSVLSLYSLIVAAMSGILMIYIYSEKDEMELKIFRSSMKNTIGTMLIIIFAYYIYNSINGVISISITTIGNGIIIFSCMLFIFTLIAKKSYILGLKIKSKRQVNIISGIFIFVTVFSMISLLTKNKYFENPNGYIRYDEMILYLNFFISSLSIAVIPKEKFSSFKDYQDNEKNIDKIFNIFWVLYLIIWIVIIGFAVVYPKL